MAQKIMVVEDEPAIADTILYALRTEGFRLFGVCSLATVLAVLALYRGWRWLGEGTRSWRRGRAGGRQRRGYAALTEGLVAVAAGDARESQKQARRAAALLEDAPLSRLLSAQAAQLGGDEAAAGRHFAALRESEEARFLGVRGLLVLAKRQGDAAGARRLAEEAVRLRPNAEWAVGELYVLQAAADDWDAALATVEKAIRAKAMTGVAAERRRAIALWGQAVAAEVEGRARQAIAGADKAVALAPALVPAAVLAARLHLAAGDDRATRRIIDQSWRARPQSPV